MTREDPDGNEHLILGFFVLVSTMSFLVYPIAALFFSNEDITLYKHLLYFFQALLPNTTALIVGWAVTGVITNLLVGVTALFLFVTGTVVLAYVVTQTLWMTKIKEMW